jgi:RAT1-interacting protein
MLKYERKLLKFWAQSFLLGVPKIIVGFRDQNGICHSLEELDTASIPGKVLSVGKRSWDGNICINFAGAFLDCGYFLFGGNHSITDMFLRAQTDHQP